MSSPGSGGGYCGSIAVSVSTSNRDTATLRAHLRSAGTTYHGAHAVDVSLSVSS